MPKPIKIFIVVCISLFTLYCGAFLFLIFYASGVFDKDIDFYVRVTDCDLGMQICEDDGYIEIYAEETYADIAKYRYEIPAEYDEVSPFSGGWYDFVISDKYAVSIIKRDGMHHFYLKQHILDELLYLNDDTGCAEVVYKCYGYNRILFAYDDVVAIYNGEENSIQYISLEDNTILYETELNLVQSWSYYSAWVDLSSGTIEFYRSRTFFPSEEFTIPIWRESLSE